MVYHKQENLKGLMLHSLFEAAVIAKPNKTAIVADNHSVTYAELYAQAEKIAGRLKAMGIKNGDLVGISVYRSIQLAAGIVGILKSGAAYVPMDPEMPRERLEYICRDAGIKTVVTHPDMVSVFEALNTECRLITIDTNAPNQFTDHRKNAVSNNKTEADIAYVIYTSGSTGRPRGVVISHESLCRFLSAATIDLGITPGDTYLYMASISYAVSVRQLMVPLCRGAKVVIASEKQLMEPLCLLRTVKKEGVTVMDVVPSYWRTLIGILDKQRPEIREALLDNKLRLIVSVGEPLSSDLPAKWKTLFCHRANVVNIFGQTETTGFVAYHNVTPEDLKKETIVPIGKPRSNTRLLLLDDRLEPVQNGELYIDNASLAEGYLNNPELTASKFIPCPGTMNTKKIIYRTGDRARLKADGTLQCLGRKDNQVKINGIRIELEEIEAALNRLPGVLEAAALYHRQENRISAYIVPTGKEHPFVKDLRTRLEQKIPAAVIPRNFYFLEALPKTAGGKLDRLTLTQGAAGIKEKEKRRENCEVNRKPPPSADNTEAVLLRLWQRHLGRKRIGLRDNYFELGGDSLRAVALFDTISKAFNKNIPIAILLQAPTIEQLAAVIRGKTGTGGHADDARFEAQDNDEKSVTIIPLKQSGGSAKKPVFCLHGVGGGVMFYRDLVNRTTVDVNFYGIQVPEYSGNKYDASELQDAHVTFSSLEEMAAHHLKEIRRFQPDGPYRLMGYSSGGIVAYEIARQLKEQGEDISLLVMLDTDLPVNPACKKKRLSLFLCYCFLKNIFPWLMDFCRDPENRRRLRRRIIKMTGNPAHLWYDLKNKKRQELMKQQVKLIRAYCPGAYHGNVILLRSKVQDLLRPKPEDYGWNHYITGKIDVHVIPGNHRTVLKAPHINKTAEKLSRCLE